MYCHPTNAHISGWGTDSQTILQESQLQQSGSYKRSPSKYPGSIMDSISAIVWNELNLQFGGALYFIGHKFKQDQATSSRNVELISHWLRCCSPSLRGGVGSGSTTTKEISDSAFWLWEVARWSDDPNKPVDFFLLLFLEEPGSKILEPLLPSFLRFVGMAGIDIWRSHKL